VADPGGKRLLSLRIAQVSLFAGVILAWHLATRNPNVAFFLGEPLQVLARIWSWFTTGDGRLQVGAGREVWFTLTFPAEIYPHLIVTLAETLSAFVIGTALGAGAGLWLALAPRAARVLAPYVKAANSMPRVILAPIFATWFGLGIWSKIVLAVTLVFFIVFFNVFQGVKEVSPLILSNARVMGAGRRQLLRTVYVPSALSWLFASLHNAVGLAFVGAVIGEYLGAARGIGYLIQQAEGSFDVNTVFAGIVVLTVCALVLDGIVGLIERRFMAWQPRMNETERALPDA
jgi:NitT/TauT family transport system permease protein